MSASTVIGRCADTLYLARKFVHPKDAAITFDEASHTYFVHGAKIPMSVTGIIKRYESSHFDAKHMAQFLASRPTQKYNAGKDEATGALIPMTPEAIECMWNEARDAGTALHGRIERAMNVDAEAEDKGESLCAFNVLDADPCFAQVSQFWTDARNGEGCWAGHGRLRPLATEKLVYDSAVGVAGSVDFLAINVDTGGVVLLDWKRVDTRKNFDKAFHSAKMKAPLQHLPDCKEAHYRAQLSLYADILTREYGLHIEAMALVIVHPWQTKADIRFQAFDPIVASLLDVAHAADTSTRACIV